MKNKMKRCIGMIMMLLIVGGFTYTTPCFAASAEVTISSDKAEVAVDEYVYVYLTITADSLFGDFEANLTYDDNVMEYQSGASVITGSSGFLKISDMGITEGSSTRKYTLKFKAIEVGSSEVSFSGRAMVYDFDAGNEMSVSSNVLVLNVKAPETASGNASLQSLKINPSELSPVFDKSIFEYKVAVGYETEQLIVNALPEDEKATVSITGNNQLAEGDNKIVVTVSAENGTKLEYTINLFRDYAPSETVTPGAEITPSISHGIFEVVRIGEEIYAIYSGRYTLIEPAAEVVVPTGYTKKNLIISGISITAYAPPESDITSEFFLVYAKNELGEEGFYKYDTIEKTMQRFVAENTISSTDAADYNAEAAQQIREYKANLNKAILLIVLISVICAFLILIIIRLFIKVKGIKSEDLE
ncbi:MAG: cadherin-like beta sandwich domain-containing protein [Mobilitalea sp.]